MKIKDLPVADDQIVAIDVMDNLECFEDRLYTGCFGLIPFFLLDVDVATVGNGQSCLLIVVQEDTDLSI